ncbi:hypothetical protein [Herbiconiux solani]|uniref:hypothetical protein n=1 Tax=Herbiconiux solani TaxID=661329 RepID=UPI000824E42E|nr:hypothetical protein [Herbiconiux solani]
MGTHPVPSPRRSALPAALGLVLAGAAVLLLSGCSNAHPTDALAKLAHLDDGTLLASGQTPPILAGVDSDLIPSSMRLLTEYEGTEFWVGVTRADQVCFIADIPVAAASTSPSTATDPATATIGTPAATTAPTSPAASTVETISSEEARCLDPETFGIHGAYLTPGGGSERFWLHTEYMTIPPQWTSISQNIAVHD